MLKLAGGDRSGASDGVTAGFVIRVRDAFEREASEHAVRVRVLARSTDAAPTRLAVAYSTNEVGNSGWRWRDVGPSWEVCEITYDVPKRKNGNGDYIGLMPAEWARPASRSTPSARPWYDPPARIRAQVCGMVQRVTGMDEVSEINGGDAHQPGCERVLSPAARRALSEAEARRAQPEPECTREINGRGGRDPVRYGDWEVKGLASDF